MSDVKTRMVTVREIVESSFRRRHKWQPRRYGDHTNDLAWIACSHCCIICDVLVDYHGYCLSDSLSALREVACFYATRQYDALTQFKLYDDAMLSSLNLESTLLDLNGPRENLGRLYALIAHSRCTLTVRSWHQILSFPTRACVRNDSLLVEAERKYLEDEAAMKSYEYPDLSQIRNRVESLMRLVLDPDLRLLDNHTARTEMFRRHGWLPSHGPGTTADAGPLKSDKFRALAHNELMAYAMPTDGPRRTVTRECKVLFVPKSVTSLRTISAEPATFIWHGGGVQRLLYDALLRDQHTAHHINLYDASCGSELARIGSRDQTFDTVDLSSASDFVTWFLVKTLFSRTWIWPLLVSLRSGVAHLGDQSIELSKAYPMGSRLCFPVMSIVFAALIESVALNTGHPVCDITYRVYGDDLVIPSFLTKDVLDTLRDLHFKVNVTKTFHGASPFREACGGEWYNGSSVRPLRLARKPCEYNASPLHARYDQILQLIEYSNAAFGYFSTFRAYCIHTLEIHDVHVKFGEEPGEIHSSYSNNCHLRSRFDTHYQKIVYRVDSARIAKDVEYTDPEQALLDWLSAAARSPIRENPLRGLDTPERCTSSTQKWV